MTKIKLHTTSIPRIPLLISLLLLILLLPLSIYLARNPLFARANSTFGMDEGSGAAIHDSKGTVSGTITNAVWKPASDCRVGSCLYFNGSAYVWINNGAVTTQGFTSPAIYVNGIASSAITAGTWQQVTITTGSALNATDFDIGRIEGVGYMEGQIDDVRIFNYPLTANQIKILYNQNGSVQFGQ